MKKISLFLICILFSVTGIFAGRPISKERSPMSILISESEKKSWLETEGYAVVTNQKLHYWLYDSYKYHNGDITKLVEDIIPKWFQTLGPQGHFVISEYKTVLPNTALADSVKKLMQDTGCDVSVTYIDKNDGNYDYVYINSYDKDSGNYATYIYAGTKVDR